MPREVITLQVGQCGNQIGWRFWDLALREHAKYNTSAVYDDAMTSLFRNVDERYGTEIPVGDGTHPIKSLRARAILIDMEEGVVNQVLRSPLGSLFDQSQMLVGVSGSGNNWAHGFEEYGSTYRDQIVQQVRLSVEKCDSPQSFFMLYSLGGGTGSGLGTRCLSLLEDAFPELYRFTAAVLPSGDDDVITSPYNSVLALSECIEHADCVLPIDNDALLAIVAQTETAEKAKVATKQAKADSTITFVPRDKEPPRRAASAGRRAAGAASDSKTGGDTATPAAAGGGGGGAAAGSVQSILHGRRKGASREESKAAENATTGTAFDQMNNVAAHLLTNLTSSMRFEGTLNVDLNEITTNLVPYPRLHFLLSSLSPLYALNDVKANMAPRRLDHMFVDAFNKNHQLMTADPRRGTYLACALMVRGNVQVSDVQRNIDKIRSDLRMVYWNTEGFKVGLCTVPPLNQPYALLCLANNCCISDKFSVYLDRFNRLYRARAHVHHYTQFIDQHRFDEALESVTHVMTEYNTLASAEPPAPKPRLVPAV